jgi:hypothetical protein
MKPSLLFPAAIAITAIAAAAGVIYYSWRNMGVEISGHGMLAFGLGALATFGLSAGLFYLTFKSAREGYDDIDRPVDGPQ